jgi:hypothetical protein
MRGTVLQVNHKDRKDLQEEMLFGVFGVFVVQKNWS